MVLPLVGLCVTAVAQTVVTASPQLQPLASGDAAAAEIFRKTHSTAMVVVEVRGREVHMQGFGAVKPGAAQGPAATSLIRLCSLTKIFATDLLVKMLDSHAVKLNDPLQMFAPEGVQVPTVTVHGPAARAITLGDLATHTSGLPREAGRAPAGAAHFTFPDYAQRWDWLPKQKLRTSPGTAALYSNVGFDLLGDALQAAAHEPYARVLAERTARPLGMKDTTFTPDAEQCSRLLAGYVRPGSEERGGCTDTQASAGSAGLYSTANDMAKWMEYLLGTSADAGARQNPAAQAAYVMPGDLKSVQGLDHAGEPSGIGLGWVQLGVAGDPSFIVQKTGGGAGFSTYIAMTPAEHTGVFIALTAGEGPWETNPFMATNNLLLGLSGLPPMAEVAPRVVARVAAKGRHKVGGLVKGKKAVGRKAAVKKRRAKKAER